MTMNSSSSVVVVVVVVVVAIFIITIIIITGLGRSGPFTGDPRLLKFNLSSSSS